MRIKPLNWNPMRGQAILIAESLGHKLGPFDRSVSKVGNILRMASCQKCYGFCWMIFRFGRKGGFKAGGRLLKYQCGTPEARGMMRDNEREI